MKSSTNRTRLIAGCGILIALAVILQYVEFSIPVMPAFIKLDFSDLPELIGAYAYGPWAGVAITVMKNVIHMGISQTGFVGELSNAILGSVFCLVTGYYYGFDKSRRGALIGGLLGAVLMGLFAYFSNVYLIYPLYYSVLNFPEVAILGMYQVLNPAIETVSEAIWKFNVPFTIVKGVLDVVFCMAVYKRISPLLKGVNE